METLIDDPPPPPPAAPPSQQPGRDWNAPTAAHHEDPRPPSSHRRRRRKEKAKPEGPSGQPRRQQKVETSIDDPPPSSQDPEPRRDDPAADSSRPGRRRREGETAGGPSSASRRRRQDAVKESSATTQDGQTRSPDSSHTGEDVPGAHSSRRAKDGRPSSSTPRTNKIEDAGSPTCPPGKRCHDTSRAINNHHHHHHNDDLTAAVSSPLTSGTSSKASPGRRRRGDQGNKIIDDHDDDETASRQKKEKRTTTKKKSTTTENVDKDQLSRPAKRTSKSEAEVVVTQDAAKEKTSEVDPPEERRQPGRRTQEKSSASPTRHGPPGAGQEKSEDPSPPRCSPTRREENRKKKKKEQEEEDKEGEEEEESSAPPLHKTQKVETRGDPDSPSPQGGQKNGTRNPALASREDDGNPQENYRSRSSPTPPSAKEKRGAAGASGSEWGGEEDLNPESRRLSDFKELCKSVASLLHIEDQEAVAMLTEPLSSRRDLVEGLDADAIVDYLNQHGVLDQQTLQSLRGSTTTTTNTTTTNATTTTTTTTTTSSVTQRNARLLQHVEAEGPTAVALFINALRQSGQLHLASSLDNTRRIQPVSEGGYLEKQRHKGEVTIVIKVHALLIVVPERDSEGDVIDHAMLADRGGGGLHRSYDNMLMADNNDGDDNSPNVVTDDEDDDPARRKRSFFCFCFPSRGGARKAREKRYAAEQREPKPRHHKPAPPDGRKEQNGAWTAATTTTKSSATSPGRAHRQPDLPDVLFSGDSRRNSGSPKKGAESSEERRNNGVKERQGPNKENADPVIMEYNKRMELVRLKAQHHHHHQHHQQHPQQQQQPGRTRTTSQSSAVIMCPKWKSGGQPFRKKLRALCEQFEFDLQTYLIKYVEQDRGTLVLSAWTDRQAMFVSTICMTKQQVRQLHRDYGSGALRERLDALLRTNQCLQKLDILDMDLRVLIDDDQFHQALRELA